MSFWIFKTSDSGAYPDVPGKAYVFDNTHSVRVRSGDEFLYLEKGTRSYAFTGAGRVKQVTSRPPRRNERHKDRVQQIITAHLDSVVMFTGPLDISRRSSEGRRNRVRLGLPADINAMGWSLSIPQITRDIFVKLLDAALESNPIGPQAEQEQDREENPTWRIDDRMVLVKVRERLAKFHRSVLERHRYTCLVCGTRLRSALEVAHIRSYASDPANRANPANGICLCRFCHAAFDAGDVLVLCDGSLELVGVSEELDDVASMHFSSVPASIRKKWLHGLNLDFLEERCQAVRTAQPP